MRLMMRTLVTGLLCSMLVGCDLAHPYVRPPAPIPAALPGVTETAGVTAPADATVIRDPSLDRLISRAVADNRDLRIAVEAAATAGAQYRAQRSAQAPALELAAGGTVLPVGGDSPIAARTTFATIGLSGFEIDLFSRLKNFSRAAFADYLASAQGVEATRLAVRSGVAQAVIILAADKDLLEVARQTEAAGAQALDITTRRNVAGLASGSDVANAAIILQQAKADEQEQLTRVEQDRNALQLLVGGKVPVAEEPASVVDLEGAIGSIDQDTSSAVLLRRPDVRQAEFQLQAAGLRVGAARAAFFPTVTLSSAAGLAGSTLANLFTGGAAAVFLSPAIAVPVIGGPVRANLAQARAGQRSALATYEKALQSGFRDASDGLARKRTITAERSAQAAVSDAAGEAYRLSILRFKAGEGSFLAALVDQQALYGARRRQIDLAALDLRNRVTLAAALALL